MKNLTPQPPSLSGKGEPDREGYVLIAVLIVIVVLSLAAYQFTEFMTAEYRGAARQTDSIQARHAAVSGIHYAAAMLADPGSYYGDLGGNPFAEGAFDEQIVRQGSNPRTEARFQLVSVAITSPGVYETRYGAVIDEAGKVNINALIALDPSGEMLASALTAIQLQTNNPLLTPAVIDAIVDWVDADDDPRANGAESSTYLPNGYRAKNGPLNSLDELLLVQGVDARLLYGTDRNRNGQPDEANPAPFDRGLADFLTVYGRELNLDAVGVLRENVNDSEDLPGLYQRLTARVGPSLANYIMGYKLFAVSAPPSTTATLSSSGGALTIQITGTQANSTDGVGTTDDLGTAVQAALDAGTATNRRRLKSLLDMRNTRVALPKVMGAPANAPTVYVASPLNDPTQLPLLLGTLLDATTATTVVEMTPRININTAPKEVLMTLIPLSGGSTSSTSGTGTSAGGLQESDVDNIIAQRAGLNPADPTTLTAAWILDTAKVSPDVFKSLEKYITGRSMVFRVHSIGYFGEGGPVARVEAVIDTNQGAPRILHFRDMTDLDTPRGFDPPR